MRKTTLLLALALTFALVIVAGASNLQNLSPLAASPPGLPSTLPSEPNSPLSAPVTALSTPLSLPTLQPDQLPTSPTPPLAEPTQPPSPLSAAPAPAVAGSSPVADAVGQGIDWPQVGNNPQRTGYTPEVLGTSFQVVWTHPFQPERIFPQTQPIVCDNRVFVGTEMGNMYAFNAQTGALVWKKAIGASLLNSAGCAAGHVFFASLDGAVYSLDGASGAQVWRTQLNSRLGFQAAPLLADSKILLGGQDGKFYALDQTSGNLLWAYTVGAPILQTAAYDNGKVFFGAMNMYVYALNTSSGALAWRSNKIPQMAFKDYWPVVTAGKVIERPMGLGQVAPSDYSDAAQTATLADVDAHPEKYQQSMFILDENSGQQLPAVIHWDLQTHSGTTTPPCVDRDGYLIAPAPAPIAGPHPPSGWAILNLATRKIVDELYDGTGAGYGNGDENLNVTCAQNLILGFHTEEYNANYTGAFDLATHHWIAIARGWQSGQMSTNTQGGGGNPPSVANGMIFHISFNELVARVAR